MSRDRTVTDIAGRADSVPGSVLALWLMLKGRSCFHFPPPTNVVGLVPVVSNVDLTTVDCAVRSAASTMYENERYIKSDLPADID